ncbi:MAG TPA: MmcQ/YjbR family DNA-binding protein [Rhizomicrobium sp.]|nr:MmcQ/YjbR family DNA-binding protein [Rhizomicrobium sp.]
MATPSDVRKIALALEGTSEIEHFARPAWRTARRIYAVMRPDGLFLHLPDERRDFLFEADPAVFVRRMWGKRPFMTVQIAKVPRAEIAGLIREAWEFNRPPAKPAQRSAKPGSARARPKTKSKPKPKPKPKKRT